MSERMADAEAIAADAGVTAAGWEAGDKTHAGRIRADWLRARSSEEQKDATIKALADALWESGDEYADAGWHTNSCIMDRSNEKEECTPICAARRAALRLAGRL